MLLCKIFLSYIAFHWHRLSSHNRPLCCIRHMLYDLYWHGFFCCIQRTSQNQQRKFDCYHMAHTACFPYSLDMFLQGKASDDQKSYLDNSDLLGKGSG